MPEWIDIKPNETLELLGSIVWSGKRRIIVLQKRLLEYLPALKNRQEATMYRMEVFLSRQRYEAKVKRILEGKEPLPIHLYLQRERV